MRVLIVQESDWLKKGPHDQHHLAEKLSLRGHEVRVIDFEILWRSNGDRQLRSGRQVFPDVSKIYDGGHVTVIRPGIVKARLPGADYLSLVFSHWREIQTQMREFAPDVIIGLGILNNYLAMKAARKHGIPFVCYWLDVFHTLIPIKCFRFAGKAIERRILRQSAATLATNRRLRSYQVELGAAPGRAHVLRHGVDRDMFDPDRVDGRAVRKRYGIAEDDIVVTFVGRLSRISGVREVARQLRDVNGTPVRFVVVGSGSREDELRQMRETYGLQDRLIVMGRRPYEEVPGLVAASDICLLPYHNIEMTRDIVPLKILDYMALGKPVVSTRLPGMVEEFGEGNGVVYVDRPEDVVARALALADEGNLGELGARARAFVRGYSWDRSVSQLESILKELAGEPRAGVC